MKISTSSRVISAPVSHDKLFAGANLMAELIRHTLGPVSRTVVIKPLPGKSDLEILEDGGTIARRVYRIQDRYENMGAMILRSSLTALYDKVGDGTATAAVIFQAILRASRKLIAAGANPTDLRTSLNKTTIVACELLKASAKPLDGQEEITRCALAVCHDQELANLLGEAFYLTGGDGYVRALEWHRRNIEREYFEGCYWTGTWVSSQMINDPTAYESHLDDVAVFVTDMEVTKVNEIVPVMEAALAAGRKNLLMVVGELSGPALSVVLTNLKSGVLKTLAVKSSALYSEAPYLYEDLSYLTGAHPFLRAMGDSLLKVSSADLGTARKAWATITDFGIVAGGGDPHTLRQHTATLRKRLKVETKREEVRLLRKRLGKLMGGAVTIHVGAATEAEMKLRLAVAKRAISTLHLAMEAGVVPGSGSTLVHIAENLRKSPISTEMEWGINVLAEALEEPLRAIAQNAGLDSSSILSKVRAAPFNCGLDARIGELVNCWEAGIVDPAAVLEAAVKSASQTAALLMTTEVLIHSKNADRDFLPDKSIPRRVYENRGK